MGLVRGWLVQESTRDKWGGREECCRRGGGERGEVRLWDELGLVGGTGRGSLAG